MTSALICLLSLLGQAVNPAAAPDTGAKIESVGTLITVDVKPGPSQVNTAIKAKVGDLLQFRITSPVLGRTVLSLQASVDGEARRVAVVSTATVVNAKPEPGSEGVSVFVVPEKRGQATVKIVFVDNEGKPFRRVYNLEVVER
jgi:hypothetical protein